MKTFETVAYMMIVFSKDFLFPDYWAVCILKKGKTETVSTPWENRNSFHTVGKQKVSTPWENRNSFYTVGKQKQFPHPVSLCSSLLCLQFVSGTREGWYTGGSGGGSGATRPSAYACVRASSVT